MVCYFSLTFVLLVFRFSYMLLLWNHTCFRAGVIYIYIYTESLVPYYFPPLNRVISTWKSNPYSAVHLINSVIFQHLKLITNQKDCRILMKTNPSTAFVVENILIYEIRAHHQLTFCSSLLTYRSEQCMADPV